MFSSAEAARETERSRGWGGVRNEALAHHQQTDGANKAERSVKAVRVEQACRRR